MKSPIIKDPQPRVLFVSGAIDKTLVSQISASIININAEDDYITSQYIENLQDKLEGLCIRNMKDQTIAVTKLADGTDLGLGYNDETLSSLRKPIILHISSGGGEVEQGLALVDLMRTSDTEIHAYIHHSHSMAFVIACACDRRFGYKNTRMMIHDVSLGINGMSKLRSLEETLEETRGLREMAFSVITENTDLTDGDLNEIYMKKQDKYFFGDDLLEYGLIDEFLDYHVPRHKEDDEIEEEKLRLAKETLMKKIEEEKTCSDKELDV